MTISGRERLAKSIGSEDNVVRMRGSVAAAQPRDLMKANPSRQSAMASGNRSRHTLVAAARAGRARPNASIVR